VWWTKRLPGVGDEAQMQRRLHEQRRVRQSLLLDLGALVYELHRQGKRAPDLLQRKAAQLTVVDDEIRELEDSLGRGLVGAATVPPEQPHEELDVDDGYEEPDEPPDSETEEVDALEPEHALANNHQESHR
jgi:hypothetical protein